jgi:hypothetical protein
MGRRKLTEAEQAEKNRLNCEAYAKIYADMDRIVAAQRRNMPPKKQARPKRVADKTYARARLDSGCLVLSPNRWPRT